METMYQAEIITIKNDGYPETERVAYFTSKNKAIDWIRVATRSYDYPMHIEVRPTTDIYSMVRVWEDSEGRFLHKDGFIYESYCCGERKGYADYGEDNIAFFDSI